MQTLLKWFVQISRFGMAAMFLFAAGAKLAIIKTFAANVSELLSASGLSPRWTWPITSGVVTAEIIATLLLLFPAALVIAGYRRSQPAMSVGV